MNNNENGYQKAFTLTPPKSPDEVAREAIRKIAPELRRSVRSMKICAQAKFLFGAILDDTFMFDFGGDGHGRLLASIHDLTARYCHDKDSISKWAKILRNKEVLWFERCWPYWEWRITALCPAPDHKASPLQKIRARASAKRYEKAAQSKAEGIGDPPFSGKNGKSPSISEGVGGLPPTESPSNSEGIGSLRGRYRRNDPTPSPNKRGHLRRNDPIPSEECGDTTRNNDPIPSDHRSEDKGTPSASRPVVSGTRAVLETSPVLEIGSIGDRGGDPTPKAGEEEGEIEKQLADWRQSLVGTFPAKLEKMLTRLVRERDNEIVPNVRQFISRKIKMIHELLDGPKPKPQAPALQPTRAKSAQSPLSDQEILEGARYLVSIGKKDLLTEGQKKVLASAK